MNIASFSANKSDVTQVVCELLESEFEISQGNAKTLAAKRLVTHIEQLIDSVWFFVETPYVDKVYRDSYYNYFSSKSRQYKKDCIRISIFSEEIPISSFRSPDKLPEINNKYLGFIILRPTTPFIMGRSCIAPQALKDNNFLCCTVTIPATGNMIKLKVNGFPHSSQDTETISCAETTIWAIMEYFGYKYAEYKPSLPSRIIEVLRSVSAERQTPSRGLNIQQMAFTIKEFGFGPRIYSRLQFRNAFHPLIRTYIESGIPLILAIQNSNIGHAILCIGRDRITDDAIDQLPISTEMDPLVANIISRKAIQVYDIAELENELVFIDDNRPAYQKAPLLSPAKNYPADWEGCEVTYFITPLYPKIYLEAFEAKKYFKQFFFRFFGDVIAHNSEIVIRFFLASSRSFKHAVAINVSMDESIKDFILETGMPKFVWVGELSDKQHLKDGKATGIVILDATEANIYDNKPLIFSAFNEKIITFDSTTGSLRGVNLPFSEFEIFINNLGGF